MARRAEKPRAPSGDSRTAADLWTYAVPLALVWLVTFAIYFLIAPLQNNSQFDRLTLALLMPEFSAIFAGAEGLPSGLRYLPQRFDLIAVASLIAAGAWGLGGLALRLLTIRDTTHVVAELSRVERGVFTFGLGLSAWSLLTLTFGLSGWLSRPLFIAVLLAAFAVELFLFVRDSRRRHQRAKLPLSRSGGNRPQLPSAARREPRPPAVLKPAVLLCLAVVGPFVLLAALAAMLPPFDFDVKEYHLGGPKEWFLDGRVHFLPHNVYTSFPALTEMLSLSAMVVRGDWFRGALAGQLVLAAFFPLTVATVYAVGRRLFGEIAGLCGAAIYATTPWSYRIAVIAYAEGGLTYFLALSLLAAVIAIQRRSNGQPTQRFVLLAGLFAGSAMACKYPGVVQAVIPIGVALLASSVWQRRAAGVSLPVPSFQQEHWIRHLLATAAIFAVSVLLTVGPWLVKNAVETRNPVYPLLWSGFGGVDWDAELNETWKAAHSPPHHDAVAFVKDIAGVAVTSDRQSLLVFGLAPLALLGRHRRSALGLWAYVCVLYAAWWILTHRIERFWVPLLPVASVLAGAGAAWIEDLPGRLASHADGAALQRLWRYGAGGIALLAILFNLGVVTTPLAGKPHYLADLDAVAKSVATPNLAVLNDRLPNDAKVLLVGEAEIFDARFPVVYNTVFDQNIFEEWAAEPQSGQPPEDWPLRPAEDVRRTIAEHGITHIFVNWREILRYRTTYGFTAFVTPERFASLRRQGLLGQPSRIQIVPLAALNASERREAESRFADLIQGRDDDRTFVAGELYPVISTHER